MGDGSLRSILARTETAVGPMSRNVAGLQLIIGKTDAGLGAGHRAERQGRSVFFQQADGQLEIESTSDTAAQAMHLLRQRG